MSKPEIQDRGVTWEADPDADPSYLDQPGFEDRLAAYNAGDFGFMGCVAWADVLVAGSVQRVEASVWGVEGDCDGAYRQDVERDVAEQLDEILVQLGAL